MVSVAALGFTALLLAAGEKGAVPSGMAKIPAGTYAPLYGPTVRVNAFALDRLPVTRGEFLAFVREHREWRRANVNRTLADPSYLGDWSGELEAGQGDDLRKPVVNVSWFAANAYCAARGKRLPTTAEWERAASASATRRDATGEPAFEREVLALYAARSASAVQTVGRGRANAFGLFNLHDLVWELTFDLGVDEARSHSRHYAMASVSCASAAIGAANTTNYAAFLRNAVRSSLQRTSTTQSLGFRCASDI